MIWRWLRLGSIGLVAFAVLCAGWFTLALYLNKGRCAVLPNGYMIGHVSVFKRKTDVLMDMYLRDPSREIVLRTNSWVDFDRVLDSPGTVRLNYPGGTMEMDGTKMMPLIWEGLPIGGPKRQWNEPDPEFPHSTDIISTDFWGIYRHLKRSPNFKLVYCGTPWFDRGE